jgi:hypothetical protein
MGPFPRGRQAASELSYPEALRVRAGRSKRRAAGTHEPAGPAVLPLWISSDQLSDDRSDLSVGGSGTLAAFWSSTKQIAQSKGCYYRLGLETEVNPGRAEYTWSAEAACSAEATTRAAAREQPVVIRRVPVGALKNDPPAF